MNDIPILDIHTHFHQNLGDMNIYLAAMERNNVARAVSLSQAYSSIGTNKAYAYIARLLRPEMFIVFTAVDYRDVAEGDEAFIANACRRLEDDVMHGAQGLKLHISNAALRIPPDDIRLRALYDKAAELSIPILYHVQLQIGTRRAAAASAAIPASVCHEAMLTVLKGHPETNFILAHNGSCCDRPSVLRLSGMLGDYPNLYVDTSATFLFYSMLKQVDLFRQHFVANQDRILFGTDINVSAPIDVDDLTQYLDDAYEINRKFLGTSGTFDMRDELRYRKREWVYDTRRWETLATYEGEFVGLGLHEDILEKVFHKNAEKLLGPEHELDREWVIDAAGRLLAELKKARDKSTTRPMEFTEYFTFAAQYVGPFFEEVVASQGPEALRTAYNDTWTTPPAVTDQFIATLAEAVAGL